MDILIKNIIKEGLAILGNSSEKINGLDESFYLSFRDFLGNDNKEGLSKLILENGLLSFEDSDLTVFIDLLITSVDVKSLSFLNDSSLYNEALKFSKDIDSSIKRIERKNIKDRFKKLEEEKLEIDDNDIESAIVSIEREGLKKRFRELEKSELEESNNNLNVFLRVAAILIVVAIPAYFIFQPDGGDPNGHLAKNTTINLPPKKSKEKVIPPYNINEEKFALEIDEDEKESFFIEVKSDENFGYVSQKDNKIEVEVINLNSVNNKIGECLDMKINGKTYRDSTCYALRDSINNLDGKFTFINSKIVLQSKQVIKKSNINLLKLEGEPNLFLKLNDSYYNVTKSEKPIDLILLKDYDLIELLKEKEEESH